MADLISFISATRRLENTKEMFDNLEATASDLSCFEVLIKLDEDHEGAREFIEEEAKKRPFTIKYIITPRLEGTFSLGLATEQLFFMSDPDSYFIQFISDEVRFVEKGWDEKLRKYVGFFPDDIFRLRLSLLKLNSYASHYECTFRPDSFAIFTRSWLELTQGMGDCWASDAYQQCVAFHLHLGPGSYNNIYRVDSIWRDIPIFDIELDGIDWGVGVSPEDQRERHFRNLREWARLTCYPMQERFSYFARRIFCYMWAYENGVEEFTLHQDERRKTVSVITPDGKNVFEVSYYVPRMLVYMQNLRREWVLLPVRLYQSAFYWKGSMHYLIVKPLYYVYRLVRLVLFSIHHALALAAKFFLSLFKGAGMILAIVLGGVAKAVKAVIQPIIDTVKRLLPESEQKEGRGRLKKIWRHFYSQYEEVKGAANRARGVAVTVISQVISFPLTLDHLLRQNKDNIKAYIRANRARWNENLRVPFNAGWGYIDRLTMPPPPGLATIDNPGARLPPRVQPPSVSDREWARAEVARVVQMRRDLDAKTYRLRQVKPQEAPKAKENEKILETEE